MSGLDLFRYADRDVRVLVIEGEPWFVLRDVCHVLDIAQPVRVAEALDEDEVTTTHVTDTLGREQSTYIVSESGLYSLILRSRKPEAKAFKRWITHDVLPAIRKTDSYGSPAGISFEEMTAQVIHGLQERIEAAQAKARELEAPAAAWNDLAAADGDLTISDAAKNLARAGISTGPKKLHDWLEVQRWIFRRGGRPVPMQTAVNAGLLVEKVGDYRHPSGDRRLTTQVRVTPKGLERLRDLLAAERDLVLIEGEGA